MTKNMLDIAKTIAQKAHEGQFDKSGKNYINHPIKVASMVKTEDEKIVAMLHDVIEDSSYTIDDLKNYGFNEEIINAIDAITKRKGQSYDNYILKLKESRLAVKVKIADLTHNSDLSRLSDPTQEDFARKEKYLKIKSELTAYLNQEK